MSQVTLQNIVSDEEVWLSFGCGVQTCFMLFKYPERYKKGGLVFADTGDETLETYFYMKMYVEPFCENNGIRLEKVTNPKWRSLLDHCLKRRIMPSTLQRWCTKEHKVQPIQRFYRKILKVNKKNPVHQDLGFSYDEYTRSENQAKYTPKYVVNHYPLVDLKITREDCVKGFAEMGYPTPPNRDVGTVRSTERSTLGR